ncbi:hypothetical protein SESBI_24584 [Sesbania bispinosa]|nr:hypothetical protein SESBI_24584 [Sesbania bispinosa]
MTLVHGPFDAIKDIVHGREAIRLKGGRIQASIRKAMIRRFRNSIVEGGVYRMNYFGIIENGGEYRGTFHEFKLLFQPKTTIYPAESELIPRFGVAAKTSEEIQQTNGVSDYLYDFIGLLTTVGEEKEFKKFGRTIRVLEVELIDDK